MKHFVGILFFCLIFTSCLSVPPIDRGVVNNAKVEESDLAILNIEENIYIKRLNEKDMGWGKVSQIKRSQIVKLNPGVHTFTVIYNDGELYTKSPMTVIGKLEKGQSYVMKAMVGPLSVKKAMVGPLSVNIRIENSVTEENATLNMQLLRGSDIGVVSSYIKYVLNPTMKENNKSVRLENDTTIIIYKPDMTYTQQNKQTGFVVSGYKGFVTDFLFKEGTVYLYETDVSKITKDEFLNKIDCNNEAQTKFIPIKCSEKSVTYKYVKPESMKDKEVTFNISQF